METKNPIVHSEYYCKRIISLRNMLRNVEDELSSDDKDDPHSLWRLGVLDSRRMSLMSSLEKLKKEEKDRNSLLAEMSELFQKIVDKPDYSKYGDDSEDHY